MVGQSSQREKLVLTMSFPAHAGFLGSHVVEQFLEFGFKVRGTVRNLDRLSNLERRWDSKYPGLFQAVEIPDLTKEGCYAEAIKGERLRFLCQIRSRDLRSHGHVS